MKTRKNSLVLSILATAMILTGCQKTPSTTIINNTPTKDNVSGTEETIDVESLPKINMSYEIVNEVFWAGDKTVTLNGYIGKPDSLEGLCAYNAKMAEHKKYDENMDFLFGDMLDQVNEDEYGWKQVDGYDDVHEYPIYLAYLCNWVEDDKNYVIYSAQWVPLSGETIPVNMTMEEAIAKADEILERIGVEGFALETVGYFDEVPMEGYWPNGDYYSVTYRQFLQGVPVAITTKTGHDISYAEIRIQERGIELVRIEQLDFYVDRQIEECITYEEALEIFLNYVKKSSEYEDFGLESIAFEYVVKDNYGSEEYDFTVVPCWRFSVDDYHLKDIVIEAENGNLSCIDSVVHSYYGSYDRLYGLGVE